MMLGNAVAGLARRLDRAGAAAFERRTAPLRVDEPIVSFTFDDFPKSAAQVGKDILERHGWRGTYYASGALMGACTLHGTMFDPGDLVRLANDGHEIGCHTFSHVAVTRLSEAALEQEIDRNRRFLHDLCGVAPATFAYPYGEANPYAKRLLSRRFDALRGIRPGTHRGFADLALLKAVPVDGGGARLDHAMRLARSLASKAGWIVFFMHEIDASPSVFGCTPEDLKRLCGAVARSGARVLPVVEALGVVKAELSG